VIVPPPQRFDESSTVMPTSSFLRVSQQDALVFQFDGFCRLLRSLQADVQHVRFLIEIEPQLDAGIFPTCLASANALATTCPESVSYSSWTTPGDSSAG